MVPNGNFAHRARSSQVNMLCIIDKYRLCEFHLNALAGQKGEFCDLVTLNLIGRYYKAKCAALCARLCNNLLVAKST